MYLTGSNFSSARTAWVAILTLIVCLGCGDSVVMESRQMPNDISQLAAIVRDPSLTPQTRTLIEEDIVDKIVTHVPRAAQEDLRHSLLHDSTAIAISSSSSNVEIAQLLELLSVSRRTVRASQVGLAEVEQDIERTASDGVRVLLMLVAELTPADAHATIIRLPGNVSPILLLRESDFTTSDLDFGLRLAAQMVTENPSPSQREYRQHLFRTMEQNAARKAPPLSPALLSLVAVARRSPLRSIPGVGTGRALEILTSASMNSDQPKPPSP